LVNIITSPASYSTLSVVKFATGKDSVTISDSFLQVTKRTANRSIKMFFINLFIKFCKVIKNQSKLKKQLEV